MSDYSVHAMQSATLSSLASPQEVSHACAVTLTCWLASGVNTAVCSTLYPFLLLTSQSHLCYFSVSAASCSTAPLALSDSSTCHQHMGCYTQQVCTRFFHSFTDKKHFLRKESLYLKVCWCLTCQEYTQGLSVPVSEILMRLITGMTTDQLCY